MKAELKFDLPEEKSEFDLAYHGADFAVALYQIDSALRQWQKHGHNLKDADDCIEKTRKYIYDCLDERGITFDMIL